MPLAVEQFDLSSYDLVISSSHAVAKGVITGPDTRHLCYCYTPMRYAWDLQHEYLRETRPGRLKNALQRYLLHRLRLWDLAASQRPDAYLAISEYIARRIAKHYRRPAQVIYPPVNVSQLAAYPEQPQADYYLAASRLVPYKRLQLILEAFAGLPNEKLIIIGDGPERPRLERRLKQLRQQGQNNITYLGYQPDAVLHQHLAAARAFIFAAEEDFGILPVEAQALGTPVIAYGKGGARETVKEGVTGLFFDQATPQAIQNALQEFASRTWSPQACRDNARRFSLEEFRKAINASLTNQETLK